MRFTVDRKDGQGKDEIQMGPIASAVAHVLALPTLLIAMLLMIGVVIAMVPIVISIIPAAVIAFTFGKRVPLIEEDQDGETLP